ncbi:MAG: heme exporter protein CcmB, partial [Gammaproteobacteria bacterium]
PLVLLAPVLALQFGLSDPVLAALVAGLVLGTPVLSVVGAIGAALTLGVRGGGVLLSLLILPLYIPVLIFGAGAIDAAINGLTLRPHLLLLAGILAAALPLAPWAGAAALRQAVE